MRAPSGKSNFVVAVEQSSADEAGVVLPLEVERSSEEAGMVLPRLTRLSDPRRRRPGWGSLGAAPTTLAVGFSALYIGNFHRPMRSKIALVQCDQLFGAHCHSAQHRVWALCP